jgi:hypothetical protein
VLQQLQDAVGPDVAAAAGHQDDDLVQLFRHF